MDSFEANKIFGALLGTVFVLFGGSLVAENIFHSELPEQPGYAIEAPEPTEGGTAAPEAVPIATLLQDADAEAGATVFRRCQACHSNEDGAPAGVGPHLWNVVNREVAHDPGFSYSAAMTAFAEGGAVMWDYQHLNDFLLNPRVHIPGTAMSFAGIQSDGDRADLIAYLRTLSTEPAPLPEAPAAGEEPAAEGEAAAPAEGGEAEATAPAEGEAAEGEAAAPAEGEAAAPAEGEAAGPAAGEPAAPAGGEAAPVGATNDGVPASDQPQAPAQSDASASGAPVAEPGTVGTATEGTPPAGVNQASPDEGANADAPAGAAPAEQPAAPAGEPAPAAAPADGAAAPAAEPAPAPAPAGGTTIVPAPAAGAPAQQ